MQRPTGDLRTGPTLCHRNRRPLRRDRSRSPKACQHDQISRGGGPWKRSRPEEGTEQGLAGCGTGSTGLLDVGQGGRGRTQSLEGQPKGFVQRVHRVWAYRGGQPVPRQVHLHQVRTPRTPTSTRPRSSPQHAR
jgi:hypothetical protein